MEIEAWRLAVTAAAAIAATGALLLNAVQFRRIERSIRGGAYQQLANEAFEIKKILLQYEELEYLSVTSASNRQLIDGQSCIHEHLIFCVQSCGL